MPDSSKPAAARDINLWEGIFDNWNDAAGTAGVFDGLQWLDSSSEHVSSALEKIHVEQDAISGSSCSRDYILPCVCAMAQKTGKKLRVLDFGGGLAASFFNVVSSLHSIDDLEFHVVEGKGVCSKAAEIFPEGMQLYFHDQVPENCGRFDVIHAGSSLQYINDWRGLLASFAALQPGYLVLADVLAGNIKPFVTVQNYYEHRIRIRFLNLRELIDEAAKLGFQLRYKSLYVSQIFDKVGPLPMDNFPGERRLKHPCQLLFEFRPV